MFSFKKTTLIALAITFLISLAYFQDFKTLKFLELKSYDLKMLARGFKEPVGDVVIVAIDEKSLDNVGRWPWSRDIQSDLLNKLVEAQVRVIAYDVVFPETDTNPGLTKIRQMKREVERQGKGSEQFYSWLEQVEKESDTDRQFSEAIKKSGRTILGYFFHFADKGLGHLSQDTLDEAFENIRTSQYNLIRFGKNAEENAGIEHVYAAEPSLKTLSEAAESSGYFSFLSDEDGAIRKVPLIVKLRDSFFPPLSIQALKLYLKDDVSFHIQEYGVESVEIGELIIPTDEKGKLLINYYGPQFTFPHYSASDILLNKITPEKLKGKIVIIGATAFGIQDLRVTPFQVNYPGVEIHATIIDNVLSNRFLISPEWVFLIDIFAIFFGGILISLFSSKSGVTRGLLITLLIGEIFIYLNYRLFLSGIESSVVFPLINIVLVYVGISLFRLFTEGKEKRFIKDAFEHYLSPTVINELAEHPEQLKLGGERRELTAFFSDIAGFSTISEKLEPEGLVELLNVYLTEMTEIILEHGGTVDKFEGDAIIAFFGAPIKYEDHAKRACLVSVEMQIRLEELRKQWRQEGKHELFVRIGLNTGPMVVGNMGSEKRMDYTMMGDSVNLASRLEEVNKQYGTFTMISESTYNAVKDLVEVRKLDKIRVVGKSEAVEIFELLSVKGKLTEKQRKIRDAFHEGLSWYFEREWTKAISCFETLHHESDDPASLIFAERCKRFRENPPEKDWDGGLKLTSK